VLQGRCGPFKSPFLGDNREPPPQELAAMATSVDAKLLKTTKFPPEFNKKVDMRKVNVEVMKKCVASEWPFQLC
jgi:hypothetical protein